jgi:1-acyl-sn-glycerol-3-phosphate acyltransferase
LIPRNKDENKPEERPIEKILQALDEGNSLVLFPEGSRGEAEKMQTFKKGIGVILKKRKEVPYIPVYMCGLGKAMPKGRLLLIPHECAIYFGEPTYAISDDVDEIVLEIESNVLRLAETYHEKVKNNELAG